MPTFYGYDRCSTCRNALKWLKENGVEVRFIDITTDPPDVETLAAILDTEEMPIGRLFNRSGIQYRELKLKDRLPTLSRDEALALLASNGRLIRRPVVTDGTRFTVGFDEARYRKVWGR